MYIKILNASETHHGFAYRDGENVCATFDPATLYGDGLYYTDDANWAIYFPWGTHFREVLSSVDAVAVDWGTDDAAPILNGTKWKARAITLGPVRPYADLLATEAQRLAAVGKNRAACALIEEPSDAVLLRASEALYIVPDGDATAGMSRMFIGYPVLPDPAAGPRTYLPPPVEPEPACTYHFALNLADHQPTGRLGLTRVSDWTIRVCCAWDRLERYAPDPDRWRP